MIRKATVNKSMRITWQEPASNVDVGFYSKADNKSQVAIEHGKLQDAAAGERMKAYWGEAFDRLRTLLERAG